MRKKENPLLELFKISNELFEYILITYSLANKTKIILFYFFVFKVSPIKVKRQI